MCSCTEYIYKKGSTLNSVCTAKWVKKSYEEILDVGKLSRTDLIKPSNFSARNTTILKNIQNKVLIDLKIWKFLCQEYKRDGCWVLKEFRKSVDCRLGGQAKYTCVENPGSTRHFTGGLTVRVNTHKSGGGIKNNL